MIHLFIGPPGDSTVEFGHAGTSQFTAVLYVREELRAAEQLNDDLLEKFNVFYCLVPLLVQTLVLVGIVAMKSHLYEAREISSTGT